MSLIKKDEYRARQTGSRSNSVYIYCACMAQTRDLTYLHLHPPSVKPDGKAVSQKQKEGWGCGSAEESLPRVTSEGCSVAQH